MSSTTFQEGGEHSGGSGARPDPLIGTVLDKDYRVLRQIGAGGMSIVYLVEHARLGKTFAAKLLHHDLVANPDAVERFETEAKSACQLEHENIVRVTDYGIAVDGRPYLVMEDLRGRTLDEDLKVRRLKIQESVLVIVSVCRALARAHAHGIVHRDIKPENIFLCEHEGGGFAVKVLDFGIAKTPFAAGKVTKHGRVIGSPRYMAPEACRGEDVDHRTDVYSVGVLMYLLFTGVLPHDDENLLRLLQMQLLEPILLPSLVDSRVSPAIESVIMRALAKEPEDRYVSMEHLLRELELALPPGADELLAITSRMSTGLHQVVPSPLVPLGIFPRPVPGREQPRGTMPPPYASAPSGSTPSGVVPSPAEVAEAKPGAEPRINRALVWALGGLVGILAIALLVVAGRPSGSRRNASPARAAPRPETSPSTASLPPAHLEAAHVTPAPAAPAPEPAAPPGAGAAVPAAPERPPHEAESPHHRASAPQRREVSSPRSVPREPPAERPAAAPPASAPTAPTPPATDCTVPYYFEGTKKIFKPKCL